MSYDRFVVPTSFAVTLLRGLGGKDAFHSKLQPYNPFTPDSAKSIIDRFSKITNWRKLQNKQQHSKVLLNSFLMNGHTLGVCP